MCESGVSARVANSYRWQMCSVKGSVCCRNKHVTFYRVARPKWSKLCSTIHIIMVCAIGPNGNLSLSLCSASHVANSQRLALMCVKTFHQRNDIVVVVVDTRAPPQIVWNVENFENRIAHQNIRFCFHATIERTYARRQTGATQQATRFRLCWGRVACTTLTQTNEYVVKSVQMKLSEWFGRIHTARSPQPCSFSIFSLSFVVIFESLYLLRAWAKAARNCHLIRGNRKSVMAGIARVPNFENRVQPLVFHFDGCARDARCLELPRRRVADVIERLWRVSVYSAPCVSTSALLWYVCLFSVHILGHRHRRNFVEILIKLFQFKFWFKEMINK